MVIRIKIIKTKKITAEGYKKWKPWLRPYLKNQRFISLPSMTVEEESIDDFDKLTDFIWNYSGEGKSFLKIKVYSSKLNKWYYKKIGYVVLKPVGRFNEGYEIEEEDLSKIWGFEWFKL